MLKQTEHFYVQRTLSLYSSFLHKIIILLTEEANNKNITNEIIKKQTYQIDSLISKQIDFTNEINKQKEMNNPELTDDSFELSNIEDYETEPSPEQNESEYVIEGVVNTNSLNKLKSILQESIVKTETKEEIINENSAIIFLM